MRFAWINTQLEGLKDCWCYISPLSKSNFIYPIIGQAIELGSLLSYYLDAA